MKKALFVLLMLLPLSAFGRNDIEFTGDIGPTFSSVYVTNIGTGPALGTAAASTSGDKNCLEYVTALATGAFTVYILNGNTTSYQMTYAASQVCDKIFYGYFCGSANTAMTIKAAPSASSTTVHLNYKGKTGR